MSQQITLEVSEKVFDRAATLAARRNARLEEVLSNLLETAISENSIEEMSDAEILALSQMRISDGLQEIFSELLDKNREGLLSTDEKRQLDELGELCEQKMLQKAKALRVAVERGLVEPLRF